MSQEAQLAVVIERLIRQDDQLAKIENNLGAVLIQTTKTNGRVSNHDTMLADSNIERAELRKAVQDSKQWIKGMTFVGSSLLVVFSVLAWLIANDFLVIQLRR